MVLALMMASFAFVSCDDDDPTEEVPVTPSNNITSNTTWAADEVHELNGRVFVTNGATLTIEPGAIIKAAAGTGANASALIVARDGKIDAQGTAESPIIFTSAADEIEVGETESSLSPDFSGLWGGLIILGNAPGSFKGDVQEVQIEGIPPSEPLGLYGGSDATHNSGTLRYVSVRHGGANIGEGNEINGITLGGVGSGTTIEHVEVVANQDDGIEFFGGTVNVSNAVVWNAGDDAIDTDQAWSGTLNNFVVVCGTDTDHGLEIDGPEGSANGAHTLTNGTVKGDVNSELANFRDGAQGNFNNLYFFNFPNPNTEDERGDFSFDDDPATEANFVSGVLSFSDLETTLPDGLTIQLSDVFKNNTAQHASNVETPTVGANTSVLSWTYTASQGQF